MAARRDSVRAVLTDRWSALALGTAVVSGACFAAGPGGWQQPTLWLANPVLCGLTAAAQWRVGSDPRLPRPAARFWRLLAAALATFTLGMVVDIGGQLISWHGHRFGPGLGVVTLFPVGSALSLVALAVFPTPTRTAAERITMGLDVAIAVFSCAIVVWYFMVSPRWRPSASWGELADSAVLPMVSLVAVFAVLRIASGDRLLIRRATVRWIAAVVVVEVISIAVTAPAPAPAGRFGSVLQTAGLAGCTIAAVVQRRGGPNPLAGGRPQPRRTLTALPFGTAAAAMALLVLALSANLDPRGWVIAAAVVGLATAVMARQLTALWEHGRLLAANRALTDQLRHRAFHDHLTGLANRTLFTAKVTEALAAVRSDEDAPPAVLFFDLDDFKLVNDSLGHQAGDELLRVVARRLAHGLTPHETLGRLGGDEFAILVPGAVDGAAERVAERVIAALDAPIGLNGTQVRVAVSIGIAAAEPSATDAAGAAALLRNADIAMYAAKRAAKGGWRRFDPAMLSDLLQRNQAVTELAHAVTSGAFVMHYQPIVDLVDGTVRGAEALVRWCRRDGTLTCSGEFLQLAEETGLATAIDGWALAEACRAAAGWHLPAQGGFSMHVNVSASQLDRPGLLDDVSGALATSGLPAARLTIEITEGWLTGALQAAERQLTALRRLGVGLAVDGFGTGFSSLAALRLLPLQAIKIDEVFTAELRDSARRPPLARAVIALAASLDLCTIAEGVEHPEQARQLLAMGCRYGQGGHFGPPLSATALGARLASPDAASARVPAPRPAPADAAEPAGRRPNHS